MRGIRGATTVVANTRSAILEATHELLAEMIARNNVEGDDVASAWFTTTTDLNAEFPAVAARRDFAWHSVALMCGHEMDVPGALPGCLRILLHVNTRRRQDEIEHVYLRGAVALRPDRRGGRHPRRPSPAPSQQEVLNACGNATGRDGRRCEERARTPEGGQSGRAPLAR